MQSFNFQYVVVPAIQAQDAKSVANSLPSQWSQFWHCSFNDNEEEWHRN